MAEIPQDIEITLTSLKANNFGVSFVQTGTQAKKLMLDMIPLTARVGVGDSVTLRQISILEALVGRGNEVINPFTPEMTQGMAKDPASHKLLFQTERRRTLDTDVFLASSNAVTQDGKIVNIDRVGNRVAGIIFGAEKVILPIGRNKIVKGVDEAIERIKNVLAPSHNKRKQRKTPCAATGICSDCATPERICNITVILEKKPMVTDLTVILINEDLGLGWDPAWDETRISQIRANYYVNSWAFFLTT